MSTEEHDQILENELSSDSLAERYFGLTTPKFIMAAGSILIACTYLSMILFGNNSLSVLLQLEEHQHFLSDDIEHLKTENAALQKQYFELKELNADSEQIVL